MDASDTSFRSRLDRLLTCFGETREGAREHYRAYVEAHVGEGLAGTLERSVILGSEKFVHTHTEAVAPSSEVARRHWQPLRPSLDELMPCSSAAVAEAYRRYGYTMSEIADHLCVHYATVSRRIRRHEAAVRECKT